MFEIKVTGNTPEEIKENMKKMASFFDVAIAAGDAVIKPEKEEKEIKNEAPTASKPIDEEPKGAAGKEEGTDVSGNVESTTHGEADTPAEAEEPTVTLEEVRAKGTELARVGKRDLVKQVLEAAGASKLSDVPADKLGYVMQCFEKGKVM
ncbi:hypothetical protein [Cellulosilyticum sp. WCF-2]|uniref:hypothetical protein n=1 Tax=Cellulosilyticum sp. WCF-2 TaxID=2497860 RepID=UPI000F8DEC3F|nr:hypothetical protein [Cellulosilyticum sp. WCF-2]QEH69750.1 hypothetical protein EKH84_15650 [Cellulosilyticum sp. WCF-2]